MVGPFGTYGKADGPVLLFYWAVVIFWSAFSSIILSSLVRVTLRSPSVLATTTSVVLFTATFTPLLIWFTDTVLESASSARPSSLNVTLNVLIITAAIGALIYQIEKNLVVKKTIEPRIWRRLPDVRKAPIVRLSSEGHFVWIHTETQVHRIRMRFADATAELEGIDGGCVHRSHWVSRAHVIATRFENNRPVLLMTDGSEIPVSRTYRAEAERMGFLPAEQKTRALQAS